MLTLNISHTKKQEQEGTAVYNLKKSINQLKNNYVLVTNKECRILFGNLHYAYK